MAKEMKLNLNDLKVESFTTNKISGGTIMYSEGNGECYTADESCDTQHFDSRCDFETLHLRC